MPEFHYINALIADMTVDLARYPGRILQSIFIGGGTPSLLSANAYAQLFEQLKTMIPFADDIEITMEANPGTVEQQRFSAYRALGINRLSLGIQSFDAHQLKTLGRIHDDQQARTAIETARMAGFDNLNIDIMHGLPKQTTTQALHDLKTAIAYQPEHISWYQLTIEPNTVFYKTQPTLPVEDTIEAIECEGLALLEQAGYSRYEISAFSKDKKQCRHNMNYWQFGDYFGIGAGAHGKISRSSGVYRTRKARQPKDYLDNSKLFLIENKPLTTSDLLFEFMLNTTRLQEKIPHSLFGERTGLDFSIIKPGLVESAQKGLLVLEDTHWQVTDFGRRYTNDLQAIFLGCNTSL